MVSLAFFLLIALVLVAGFFAVSWWNKNRNKMGTTDEPVEAIERRRKAEQHSSAFNETPTGGIIATENKLPQDRSNENNDIEHRESDIID